MATYGVSIYGLSTYGSAQSIDYSVDPFVAHQNDYGVVFLTWSSPVGNWRYFRLVRNLSGYPSTQDDGEILVATDRTLTSPPTSYHDTDTIPGRYYYYGIWLGVVIAAGPPQTIEWHRASQVVGLTVADHGWNDRMWGLLPRFYRIGANLTDPGVDNTLLQKFLSVFAFHADMIETEYATLLNLYDSSKGSYSVLAQLGNSLGANFEPEIEARLNRLYIGNAVEIAQERGTVAGLESLINAVTGWGADISVGRNRLLDADQSQFIHPIYPSWEADTNYAINQYVEFGNSTFRAVTGNIGQVPGGYNVTTAYWAYVSDWNNTTLANPVTGGQSSWGMVNLTTPGTNINAYAAVGGGIQSPTDPTVYLSNALRVRNVSGGTATIAAKFPAAPIGALIPDMTQVVGEGIPLTLADGGQVFSASGYSASAFLSGGPTSYTTMWIDWYDAYGNLMATVKKPTNPTIYDGFDLGTPGTALTSALTDSGQTWVVSNAAWTRQGFYANLNTATAGFYSAYIATGRGDATVGVTVKRFAAGGTSGLLLRFSDPNNHIRVSSTTVQSVLAGTVTTLATFTTALADGDRMTVKLVGTAITVYANGVQIWTGTSSVNTAIGNHGMWVTN